MPKVVIVGAGVMGLAAAYHAAKAGHEVVVVEAAADVGGMAAHFDFDGLSIERFYHFICKADQPTFDLLEELGISDTLRWRKTTMGFFTGGRLHEWGNPWALLKFPEIGLIGKIRYGLLAMVSTRRQRWDAIEGESAKDWITRWCGKAVYLKLWKPLFDLKFYEHADNISAAWIWTRVKRIGRSRKSLMEEQLGFLEGGSETLVTALVNKIEGMGGVIRTGDAVKRVIVEGGKVAGIETITGTLPADFVISTVPTPYVATIVPDLPEDWKARYDAINNIGVCCLLFKLKRSVTPHFWVNISQPGIDIPGIIEFSNLRPVEETVVFVPYYMPTTHEKFSWSDEALLSEAWSYLKRINSSLVDGDVLSQYVGRLRYAQPVCEPGFSAKLPPVQTPIEGLQIADTCFYYPEDRGISESARFGEMMALAIGRPS